MNYSYEKSATTYILTNFNAIYDVKDIYKGFLNFRLPNASMNINFKLYCLVTICCSIFISELNAQSNPNFTSYKELEGVSISNIIADKNGQIWIASSNAGLMRYNGYDFKKFTHDLKDTNSIKTNFIYKLQEDIWNNIWISSVDRELIRYNPVTKAFKKYKYEHLVTRKKLEMAPPIYDFCTIGNKLLIAVSFDAPLEKSILTYDEEKDAISVFAPKSVHPDYSYVFFANHRSQSIIMGQDAQLYLLQFPDSIRKISAQDELQQLSNQSLFSDAAYDSKNKLWIVNKNAELIVFDDISKSPDYKDRKSVV